MAKTLTVYLAADLKKFNGGMRDAQRGVQGFGGTLNKMLGPALIGAGVAAAGLAVKLGVDGVKAAIEDEKAVAALAKTLDNLGLAHDTRPVEDFIYQLERAHGVADTELRPAYDRLVRSTKDTEEANRALKIAMDISAATGKSLQTVTDSLGRAYDGNTVSLGRLGLGIDKTELAAMSLDQIMTRLGDTFAGQADANARTFEGQLRRLTTATDNLKEAFGAGLLQALGDTGEATDDLVDKFEAMEPSIRIAGFTVGKAFEQAAKEGAELSKVLGFMIDPSATLGYIWEDIAIDLRGGTDAMKDMQRAANDLRLEIALLGGDPLFERLLGTPGHQKAYQDALKANNFELKAANRLYQDAAARAQRLAQEQSNQTTTTSSVSRATSGARQETEKLTKAQERLLESYELQGIAFQTTKNDLMAQIQVVEDATAAVQSYAQAIQQDLLSGIDLGNLYQAQFDEQGNRTGTSLIEGFNRAIEQAEYFGGVLTAIKAQGADQSLLEQISGLGPETGAALGQQLLDEGLVPEMNAKWTGVQDTTRELALGLVPEFLEAGRLSAIDTLNGLATQFGKDQRKFKRLGNKLGEQVGKEFKSRMINEIAEAVRQVEALATAARAEAVARAEAQQARITEQAVASAISNLIRNSDQRAGRNVQPVLQ
jgi:molybdenum-dependent DNA-binding transcriptional regulator ModE